MRVLVLIVLSSAVCAAQPIGFGIKGGIPFTDLFSESGTFRPDTKRYTIGPMAELRLPFGLGAEADVLYKRFSYDGGSGSQWEIPILAKYRLGGEIIHPYIEGGVSFRRLTGSEGVLGGDRASKGFVLGAGVEFRALLIRISPELRWTRWGDRNLDITRFLRENRNQAEFLIGISF